MKIKTDQELSDEQKSFVRKVISDPVLFATHVLGVDLRQREAEILRSIKTHRRTAVKACHGVGKTFKLADAALWWLTRYPESIVLTTSPTQRRVRTQLCFGDSSGGRLCQGSLPEADDYRAQISRRE